MERDDDIEKISKELEELLNMTSGERQETRKDKITIAAETDRYVPDIPPDGGELSGQPVSRPDAVLQNEAPYSEVSQKDASYSEVSQKDAPHNEVLQKDASYNETPQANEPDITISIPDYLEFGENSYTNKKRYQGRRTDKSGTVRAPAKKAEKRWGGKKPDAAKPQKSRSIVRPSDGLAAAFLVPVVIMIIIFAQRGIFPFGEESFLRTDMYHQYAPFFSEFQHKLTQGGSLLYSWDVGMGVNFSALYAYYLASPLNWLLILCPKSYIIEFMTYMIVFKIGLSGLSFAYYLRKRNKTSDFGIAFFGIMYAMSGYMAAYSWNIMWLDCIALFPLIVLGLERLVNKKKSVLYCITLGLSIISNYYISIMICIFMVVYFIALLIMEKKKTLADYEGAMIRFIVFSLAAGGLSAVVLLPEIYALRATASGAFNFPQTVSSYFSIFDMIARHLPNVETEIGLDHWPNVFCGTAVLMFFLLYLSCSQIKRKQKVVYCGMLLFFFSSFSINALNFIWHGFHYPNSLPCRQSFIYVFLMLAVCYEAYRHMDEIPWKHVVISFFASVIFVLMAQKLVTDEAYHFSVFYVAIIYLAAYAGLIRLWKNGVSRNIIILLALAVVSIEAAVNMTVTSVTTTNRTNYIRDNEASIALTEELSSENGFYRVEKVTRKTKNDGAWLNFPSVSLFSSTANADLSRFFKKLGCESSTNAYSITGSTPLVDSLFSVRYALYSDEPADTGLISSVGSTDHMWLYENAYTLPLGFVMPYDLEDNWQLDLTNPVDVQNDLAAVIGAFPVMEEVPSEVTGTSFSFTPEQSGDYYVYVSNKKVEKVSAVIGETSENFDNINRGYLLELGYVQAGEEVVLSNNDNEQDLVAMAYRFVPEGLQSVYEVLNRNAFQVHVWNDTELSGTLEAEKSGMLYLSIPYDKGWSVYVDGVRQNTEKLFDTFLSVRVDAGRHSVEMTYMPQGLKNGGLITAASVVFLLIVILAARRKQLPKVRRRDENTDEER